MQFLKANLSLLLLCVTFISHSQSAETYFTQHPTLTPDAEFIIFSYDSDLWKVATEGGNAQRLTAMQGNETNPSISPDGKWVAFSSNQYGNNDVYIMPIDGGEISQLTFHDSNDEVS